MLFNAWKWLERWEVQESILKAITAEKKSKTVICNPPNLDSNTPVYYQNKNFENHKYMEKYIKVWKIRTYKPNEKWVTNHMIYKCVRTLHAQWL